MSDALFVFGSCSACGRRAQKRVDSDAWFHVDEYNAFSVHLAGSCGAPSENPTFVEKPSPKSEFSAAEPHYREIETTVTDYDTVDENGVPQPTLKKYMQPVLCTCTNPECPGFGKPLPDEIRKLRQEEDAITQVMMRAKQNRP